MERRTAAQSTASGQNARDDYVVRLAKNPVRSPLGALIGLLAPTTPAELAAIFDGRVKPEAIRKWIERNRIPAWAVDLVATKARNAFERRVMDTRAAIGPGLGWNKNATRGLGEWRARKNLERRD